MNTDNLPLQRLQQYFIEHDNELGLVYLFGEIELNDKRRCLIKVGPVLQVDNFFAQVLTPFGIYVLGELITTHEEKLMYRQIFSSQIKNIFHANLVSTPLSMVMH
ncbi:MAG: hypothetical protein KKE94_16510 [Gammaproteobacteria bacterium]|nr:hypothetical protein [Gammaproteobacteria bacterium]